MAALSDLDRDLVGAHLAHQRLLGHLQRALDADELDPERSSRLPDWTVGHVITHLARNADSHVRMLAGAAAGMVVEQYVGGSESRAAQIESGAFRPVAELMSDLRQAIAALEQSWSEQTTWSGSARQASGRLIAIDGLPFHRWREVEVHHVDLGLAGYGPDDWPDDYVRLDVIRLTMLWTAKQPIGVPHLPDVALAVEPRRRLAWLLGRGEIDGLGPAGIFR